MKKYVVDASIVISSLIVPSRKIAKRFNSILKENQKGKVEILSSDLLAIEVANGLRFSVKDQALAQEYFDRFAKLPIKIHYFKPGQMLEVLKLAYQLGTTVYDSSYHYLAKLFGGIFITADKKYFEKAKELGSVELVG